MSFRPLLVAILFTLMQPGLATPGEPVVRGSFHTISLLGDHCLAVPAAETRLLPGSALEVRDCSNHAAQHFEWNVVTFEIKYRGLCLDAFRPDGGPSQAGDVVGLWYCQQNDRQKWFPNNKSAFWHDAFNIVGGGGPLSDLCLTVADDNGVDNGIDGARLTLATCNGRDNQWFRLHPAPLQGTSVAQRDYRSGDVVR